MLPGDFIVCVVLVVFFGGKIKKPTAANTHVKGG
jgi:hypothetical protein